MSPTFEAFFRSWPWNPWLLAALVVTCGIYLRGWRALRRRNARRWPTWQAACFVAALATIYAALASPIESFAAFLLSVHMVQHMLLMMIAPALVWLGAPLLPVVSGLPRVIRRDWVGPVLQLAAWGRIGERLTHPACALPLFTAATWLWHIPAIYDLALRSDAWHYAEHATFLAAALVFWYPVVRPRPARPRWSAWLLFPYLILADLQNTMLAALLTFSDHAIYPYYEHVPRLAGISALADQATAGVIMWVPGSLVFLLPLAWIAVQAMFGAKPGERPALACRPAAPRTFSNHASAPCSTPRPRVFDVLRLPVLGKFLRWRHARLALQIPMALLAVAMIYDGITGPQVAPMNLAGVLPWIHWRGLLMLSLLALGNLFCMACPFTLPHTLARRWLPAGRNWPPWLRNKWLAVGLLVMFLWAYEAFSLWDNPRWTAWITLAYFGLALGVDGVFQGAAFCKYVCPIGQFNFVQSLVSPLEVKVRQADICAGCRTHDCLRGRQSIPGCQLHLLQPRKTGNMDCTFCLDCVHACPHDNVGILAGQPIENLARDPYRSGVGRFSQRGDLAALIVVLCCGAFANAAGMVAPVVGWQDQIQRACGLSSPLPIVSGFYGLSLIVLPAGCIYAASIAGRRYGRLTTSLRETATRNCYALVPLGFSMWLAHYSFHLWTSFDVAIPATQRFLGDIGLPLTGEPHWLASCCRPVADWLPHLEITVLDAGLLASLYVGYRVAFSQTRKPGLAAKALAPWALLIVMLFAAGVWIVCQPMQMRGTMPGS